MKFEIVSHACLSVEAASVRLVVDPWLVDSVYWGAWWHCPEPVYDEGIFSADYVYLTHWHFDHMHEASLRRFDKSCHMLVPKFPVSIMADSLRELGFTRITELDHGQTINLGPNFRFTSYQVAYQDDSLCVVEADGAVILDINDSKPLPSTWKQLKRKYPRVDFMLRSHSPAWSYPSSYTFDDPGDAIPVSRESYMEAFHSAASILQPRYVVPFASSVCHPHREILFENAEIVSAFELEAFLKQHPLAGDTELAIMPHGSRWSSGGGFEVDIERAVRDPQAFVTAHEEQTRPWLEEISAREAQVRLEFETFEKFFRDFLRSLLMLARPFLKVVLVFVVEQEGRTEYWSVNFRSGRIARDYSEPDNATSVMRIPLAVLDDALKTHTFTNIDISKRWKVHVRQDGMTKHLVACVLISLFEAGYLKPGNVFSWRFLSGAIARRAEAFDYLKLCFTMLRSDAVAAAKSVTEPV
jgi:UDP-MurNAc hydroxylase